MKPSKQDEPKPIVFPSQTWKDLETGHLVKIVSVGESSQFHRCYGRNPGFYGDLPLHPIIAVRFEDYGGEVYNFEYSTLLDEYELVNDGQ